MKSRWFDDANRIAPARFNAWKIGDKVKPTERKSVFSEVFGRTLLENGYIEKNMSSISL